MKTPLWYPLLGVAVLVLACRGSTSAVEDAKTFPGALCERQCQYRVILAGVLDPTVDWLHPLSFHPIA